MKRKHFPVLVILMLMLVQTAFSKETSHIVFLNQQKISSDAALNPQLLQRLSNAVRNGGYNTNLPALPTASIDFNEDFEAAFPSGEWIAYDQDGNVNGEYFWGRTKYKKNSGDYSVWCAAGGNNGYDPSGGDYPNYCNSCMTWGPIDLTSAKSCKFYLNFWLKSDSTSKYDGLYWGASKGDSLLIKSYSGSSGGWVKDSVDVSNLNGTNWLGFDNVYFIAIFLSDAEKTSEGAYIDDVQIKMVEKQGTQIAPFTNIGANLTPMKDGVAVWGDYDNDGYLDILVTGNYEAKHYAIIYKNNNGESFSEVNAGLEPLTYGSSDWGDFDNDGDLDILHCGYNGSKDILKVYQNDGSGNFRSISTNFTTLNYMVTAWADFDNDGDLDIMISGLRGSEIECGMYQNNGDGSFYKIGFNLDKNLYAGEILTGDYDNDGDIDILLSGRSSSSARTLLYRNDGHFEFTRIEERFEGIENGAGAFGDYDNDGDLDIIITGNDLSDNPYTLIYRNDGADRFTEIKDNLIQSMRGGASWGDYDNDGDLDLIVSGLNATKDRTHLYRNVGRDKFTLVEDNFPDAAGPCAWGDYDRDGDLDLFFTGWDGEGKYYAAIYRNDCRIANRKPYRPTNLNSAPGAEDVILTWESASDGETPFAGLSYNIYVGASPGGNEIMSSHSKNSNGRRKIVALGNCQKTNRWKISNLPDGEYYWSVQAIDAAFEGSNFAEEQTFIKTSAEITVVTPNGGEQWMAQNTYNITWKTPNIEAVKIELSTDGAKTWQTIADSIAAVPASYSWKVPSIPSDRCFIKISDKKYTFVNDVSDAAFSILIPEVSIKTPNGGENWCVDSTYTITWESENIDSVKLEYSIDGGATWNLIDSSLAAKTGAYSWKTPNTPSTICLVKISSIANMAISDISDAPFRISRPGITVLTPNGGEDWCVDSTQVITWKSGFVPNLKIEYTFDGAKTWQVIEESYPADSAKYLWKIPDTPSQNCFMKISAADNPDLKDVSDERFIISRPTITVTVPNGGEMWSVDSTYHITWKSYHLAEITIDYSIDGKKSWQPIAKKIPATPALYAWQVANTPSTNCWVRVWANANPSIQDVSNDSFTICRAGIVLTAPNGGEKWACGSKKQITWKSAGVSKVKLEYSIDAAQTWQLIRNNLPAIPARYVWTVPKTTASECYVRISDVAAPEVNDVSDSSFSIFQPGLMVVEPNGGEKWRVKSKQQILWTTVNVNHLKLEYSIDGAQTWKMIADNVPPAPASFDWVVPATPSVDCWVRISDPTHPDSQDVSDNAFEIYDPKLILNAPNGGEEWPADSLRNITWTANFTGKVKLEYSSDAQTTWQTIVDSVAAEAGIYRWRLPSIAAEKCFVRILDRLDSTVCDTSDAAFAIYQPTVTVLSPNGGEKWKMGSKQYIKWEAKGITEVNLFYTSNNGTQWDTIATRVPTSEPYFWTLPLVISTECRVKIEVAIDSSIYDESDSTFTIYDPTADVATPRQTVPTEFALHQNFPNPFNPVTRIVYSLPKTGFVTLKVYDFNGREVLTLVEAECSPGVHTVEFDARKLASGIYFYAIKCGSFADTKKMILLK